MRKSFFRLAVAAVMLACTMGSVFATNPVTKGGVVKSVDLDKLIFVLSGSIQWPESGKK